MKIDDYQPDLSYLGIASSLGEIVSGHNRLIEGLAAPLSETTIMLSSLTSDLLLKEKETFEAIKNLAIPNDFSTPFLKIAQDTSRTIADLSHAVRSLGGTLESNVLNPWRDGLSLALHSVSSADTIKLGIHSQFARLSEISLFSEIELAATDFSKLGAKLSAEFTKAAFPYEKQLSLSVSYQSLIESLPSIKPNVIHYSPVVSTIPPIEILNHNRFLESVTVDNEDSLEEIHLVTELMREASDDLERNLIKLDPSLLLVWQGANQALQTNNPESKRQYAVSIRELFGEVIHRLAPDDKVKTWTTVPKYFKDGKPIRKARMLYICRGINHEPFCDFLEKDIDACLSAICLMQRVIHELDPKISKKQMDALKTRIDASIRFLLKTWADSIDN